MHGGESIEKDLITNRYSVSSSGGSFNNLGVHLIHRDLTTHYFNKEKKRTLGPFHKDYIRHLYSKKNRQKVHLFTAR